MARLRTSHRRAKFLAAAPVAAIVDQLPGPYYLETAASRPTGHLATGTLTGMARKPKNFQWVGFTEEQLHDLGFLDHIGNNAWARNSQTEALMPSFILKLDRSIGHARVKEAMAAIGYGVRALHMLDRWYSKANTGKFGP